VRDKDGEKKYCSSTYPVVPGASFNGFGHAVRLKLSTTVTQTPRRIKILPLTISVYRIVAPEERSHEVTQVKGKLY
jgi:hypothetical protein